MKTMYHGKKRNIHERKHNFYHLAMIYKRDLSQFSSYLHQIFNDQKFTFKITFEFSFLLILSDDYRVITDSQKK